MSKYTIHTQATEHELDAENILANDVTLPGEFNPHNNRLFVVGHEYGAICALWADCEQDALDTLIDEGKGDCFLVDEDDQAKATPDEEEGWARLGNAGEPCDLDMAWIQEADLQPARDWRLLCAFAEARGGQYSTLDF
jgi:hypothetical protein